MSKKKIFLFHRIFLVFEFVKKQLNSLLNSPTLLSTFLTFYFIFLLVVPISALVGILFTNNLDDIFQRASNPVAIAAYLLTFKMAFFAALINTCFGFIITWVLTRYTFIGKKYLDAAVDLPFALPTSVAGLTLTTIYGEAGWIGNFFQHCHIQIVFSELGVLLAMIFVSFPFVIRTLQPTLQEMEIALEEAAWSLGATSFQTFSRVIFPNIIPSIITGFTLAFSRSLGEFGSIVIISSNLPYKDLVSSVLIYQSLEQYDYLGASVIGSVILIIALISLLVLNYINQFFIFK